MAEPVIKPEIPKPQQVIVGETKLFLTEPMKVDGQEINSITIQSADKRGVEGIGSSVILVREASRKKGSEGVMVDKPMMNLNDFDEVSWDKVTGIQYQDGQGATHVIPKEKLQLEPTGPQASEAPTTPAAEAPTEMPADAPNEAGVEPLVDMAPPPKPEPGAEELNILAEKPQEAPMARAVLENLTEDPNTITIVGLKAYQARAQDLAERSMQKLVTPKSQERATNTSTVFARGRESIGTINHFFENTLWKQSIGGTYFQEKARQYYMDMLEASETPFAEQSIRVAEARAQVAYDKLLADKNFLAREKTKFVDWFKSNIGARTTVQKMALEEIRAMKEAGELRGIETFEREAKAVRLRFSQDMEQADQFVRKNLGEQLEILDPEKDEHKPIVESIHSLIKRYATGEIADKAAFDMEAKQMFATTLKDAKPDIFAEAELYSSSLFEAAETLRAKASHEAGLANIDADLANMKIRLGLGQMGEATSLEPSKVARGVERVLKAFDWIESKNIPLRPALFNEATIGSAVAIALSMKIIPQTIMSATARSVAGFAGGVLAGSTFGAFREYQKLQKDYLTHVREREVGTTFGEHLKRRQWFEKFVVKQRSTDDLMSTLQSSLYTPEGVFKDTLTVDELRTGLATLADIQARKTLSETALASGRSDLGEKRIGLIQFNGRENIESQRTALDVSANRALNDLATYVQTHEADMVDVLGGNTFADFMVKLTTDQTRVLKEGVNVVGALEDPVKNILGLVAHHAPEAQMARRRFGLGANIATPEEKALGIDAIYQEFKKEARVEAIKYGVKAGLVGATAGVVLHEALGLVGKITHGDALDNATASIKETLHNRTEASVYMPGKDDAYVQSVSLSEPSADNVWHAGSQDYMLPREFEITSHITGGPDERVTTFDAVLNVPGRDIVLGNDMTEQELLAKLRDIDGITISDAQKTGEALTGGHTVDVPGLTDPNGGAIKLDVPQGYSVVADGKSFDLVYDKHVIVNDFTISDHGDIKLAAGTKLPDTLQLSQLDTYSIDVEEITKKAVETGPKVTSGTMTIEGSELNGNGGLWDHFLGQVEGKNPLATTNGLKNIFRLYGVEHNNDHIVLPDGTELPTREAAFGTEFDISRIPAEAKITLPKAVFSPEGIDKYSAINDEAIAHYQELMTQGGKPLDIINTLSESSDPTDRLHGIVLKLGYLGQDDKLPTNPEDLNFLIEQLGGSVESPAAETATKAVETTTKEVIKHMAFEKVVTQPDTVASISAAGKINIPYYLPTQMDELAREAAEANITPTEVLTPGAEATVGLGGEAVALPSKLEQLPWFPVFIPVRERLESARSPELAKGPSGETMMGLSGLEGELLTREQANERLSERLRTNPDAILDAQEEVKAYVGALPQEDRTITESLVQQAPNAMSPTTQAAIVIPVGNNPTTIAQTLSSYANQKDAQNNPLDPKKYELVVYNAMVGPDMQDEVKATVDTFVAEHPDHQVVYLSHTYNEAPGYGRMKRDVTNAVLSRVANREPLPVEQPAEIPQGEAVASEAPAPQATLPDVAIINDPGPSMAIPETYVSSMMDGVGAEAVDMHVGQFGYPKEVYEALPMVFAPYKAYELMDAITRHTHADHLPNAISGNTAVRASTLAAVGGYNGRTMESEDRELAWMIQQARKKPESVTSSKDTLLFDPKPILYTHLQRAGVEDAAGPLAQNETYKNMTWQDMGEKVKAIYQKPQLEQDLTSMYNALYPGLKASNPEAFDRNFHFTLDSLGLAHEITDGKVVILDESKLASAISGIPDSESFGEVTAKTFVEQDQSAREILAGMVPESQPEAAAAPQAETTPEQPSLSSPDVTPEATTIPDVSQINVPAETVMRSQVEAPQAVEAPQPVETLPTGINDRIDYILEKHAKEPQAKVPVTPGELMDYLKTSLDVGGVRVTDGHLDSTDGKLHLRDLTAKATGGVYTFNADLMSDPQKGLVVDPKTLQMKLPLLGRLFSGTIKNFALNLSDNMLNHIDERTNPAWKASRIDLVGEKIEITFDKKT